MPKKPRTKSILDELDILDAERLIGIARLRLRVLRAAEQLLPLAIKQCTDKKRPSPALLRLIARLATQRTLRDRPPK